MMTAAMILSMPPPSPLLYRLRLYRLDRSSMQPLCQPLRCGIRDLTPQIVPLLVVHELQRRSQILQQVQHPEAAQEW